MKYRFLITWCLLILVSGLGCQKEGRKETPKETEVPKPSTPPLFNLLPSSTTGIDFQNTLTEGLNTNILMYEYFYNGGGVAAGDLNGDSLIDLYFTSNMSENKLYLNQGKMKFADATAISGAGGRSGPWKTGVTMVDINGDNKLDIYVCYSGALPEAKRMNQLFINEGNDENNTPTFSEKAEEYGLASPGFSNQGYFLDYDRDGDLDMLLLNHNPKSLPILNEAKTRQLLQIDDPQRGIRLFRQSKGKFEDITQKAGLIGSELSYGLGLGITDVNDDGWLDFYLSNDYAVPDYLYINNQNGTFTNKLNESIGHNSQFSMGNDVGDINNDGLQDIITLDMLPEDNRRQKLLMAPDNYAKFDLNVRSGFHYQYMRNMLQLNNGNGTFSEVGQLAGISNTDWSWSALLADYDNDGWKDLYITNGYFRDYTNLDFINYMDRFVQQRGRLQREDVLEIISHMPASNVINYMFANQGGLGFEDQTRDWGFNQPSNSNGAAYADLDNDGDLDLIVNNINQPAFIYQNESEKENSHHYLQVELQGEGMNTQGIGVEVEIFYGDQRQSLEQINTRGYLSTVSPILHFGLGSATVVDSLIIHWTSGKNEILQNINVDQTLLLEEKNAKKPARRPNHRSTIFAQVASPVSYEYPSLSMNDFDRQLLLISEFTYSGPCMGKGDLNGDGLEDVFVGGASGQPANLFFQENGGKLKRATIPAFENDQAHHDVDVAIFDANGDGDLDIYVVSGGYHRIPAGDKLLGDRLYINDGNGGFSGSAEGLPEMMSSGGCAAVGDVNQDGYLDLFVGGRVVPGRYPEAPESFLLINDGTGKFSNQTFSLAPELARIGMVSDALWLDINGDNKEELVLIGEWMAASVFEIVDGKLTNKTLDYFDREYKGWWNTIEATDVNGDSKPDLVLGNVGTNVQFRPTPQQPAELYYKDFDNNSSIDPIFSYYIQGVSYPYVTRDELGKQLAYLRSKFTSYESYANTTIHDIFSSSELKDAGRLTTDHIETTLFLSNSTGKFKAQALPPQAQYSPVYTVTTLDYNQDGHSDLLLCGNNSHIKLRLGKMDANYGVLLQGDGKGNFQYIPQTESGFDLRGDVRSVVQWRNKLLFGICEGGVVSYELQNSSL